MAKKPVKKLTKAQERKLERKEIKRLTNKALKLWADTVKALAGNKCIRCEATERLNAHHIESKYRNNGLKFDLRNGLSLCPGHHKFSIDSAHQSYCFMRGLVSDETYQYLESVRRAPRQEVNIDTLTTIIANLEAAFSACNTKGDDQCLSVNIK